LKEVIAAASLLSLASGAHARSLICGMYEIDVTDDYSLKVNGKDAGSYKGTIMDKYFSYQHQYQKGDQVSEVRETQKGRMAFRIVGESRWNACVEQPARGGE